MSLELQPYLEALEHEMRLIVSAPDDAVGPLYHMMAYHLGWMDERFQPTEAYGGKRLRPLLCLLACEAAGGDWHTAVPVAAALELLHNFSLIHDDIEDNSRTRRGRPTLWTLWGVPHAINVGDTMLVLARQAATRLAQHSVTPSTALTTTDILDRTLVNLCQGQYLDMSSERQLEVTEESYLRMIGAKTAALFAASAQLGGLIGGAGDHGEDYRQFGWHLGLTFQIVDDILGIWGDPSATGKPTASDIRSRKMTLPVIFALSKGEKGRELADLYRKEHLSDGDLSRAVAILELLGAREYARRRAEIHEDKAMVALNAAGARPAALQRLRTIAESLTSRQK